MTTEVIVFEDIDGDGSWDEGEPFLPDILVFVEHNIHGHMMRTGARTDAEGHASLTGEYTHFFKVQVVVPCNYQLTTQNIHDREPEAKFGLQNTVGPADPDRTILCLQLWQDTNGDGAWDVEEKPWEGAKLEIESATTPDANGDIVWVSEPSMTTNEYGCVVITPEHACDTTRIKEPNGWHTTSTEPVNSGEIKEGEATWFTFACASQMQVIEWGLQD
jgi:hypothetical protein